MDNVVKDLHALIDKLGEQADKLIARMNSLFAVSSVRSMDPQKRLESAGALLNATEEIVLTLKKILKDLEYARDHAVEAQERFILALNKSRNLPFEPTAA